MDISLDRLKQEFEENPMGTIMTLATAATAVVAIGNMATSMRNSRTWKKEVKRRVKNTQK